MKFKGRVLVGLVSFVFCCAFAQQNAASKTFSVGCVNCGAFHYGGGRATPEAFSNEWRRLAKDFPQDDFFYSDFMAVYETRGFFYFYIDKKSTIK